MKKIAKPTTCLLILPDRKTGYEFHPQSFSSQPRQNIDGSTKVDIFIVTEGATASFMNARALRKRLRELTKGKR